MFFYDKKIRYLNYYENGVRLQNAGYVKFEVRDYICQMLIFVKAPRLMGSGEARVWFLTKSCGQGVDDKKLFGTILIRGGQGRLMMRLNAEDMGETGLRYQQIAGIRIEFQRQQYLECSWPAEAECVLENREYLWQEPTIMQESGAEDDRWCISDEEIMSNEQKESAETERNIEEKRETDVRAERGVDIEEARENVTEASHDIERKMERFTEVRSEEDTEEVIETGQKADSEVQAEKNVSIESDKEAEAQRLWQQIKDNFPIIHPMDAFECVKLSPKDLSILHDEEKELAYNSFLLHGFYNYKYIVLWLEDTVWGRKYCLGVPGVYHEREKMLGRMFGFDHFQSQKKEARSGNFGYYYRYVTPERGFPK